jgi:hypothetical protein
MKLSTALAVGALLVADSHTWAQPVRIETGLVEGIQSGLEAMSKGLQEIFTDEAADEA